MSQGIRDRLMLEAGLIQKPKTVDKGAIVTTTVNQMGFLHPNMYLECEQCSLDGIVITEKRQSYFARIDSYVGFLCQKWLNLLTIKFIGNMPTMDVK